MNIFRKIGLSRKYGKGIYIVSGIVTAAMSALVFYSPLAIPVCIMLKLLSIPVIYYLYTRLSQREDIYFYINLGISRNEYHLIPFVVDFMVFVLLMIITGKIGYAIR